MMSTSNTSHEGGRRPSFLRRVVVLSAALATLATTAGAAGRFREASLFGTFAAIGAGDGHTSASVGTVTYDGEGGVVRSILVNAPDGAGGRRLLTFEAVGTYEINADGTGVISVTNTINGSSTSEATLDFVVQESQPTGKGGQRRVTKLYAVQREPGTTVNLVTSSESLIAP